MKILLAVFFILIVVYIPSKGQIRGQVADSISQEPLAGASISLGHQGQHTRTDQNGHFLMGGILQADTLVVSFVGYLQKRIPVSSAAKGSLFVLLSPDSNALQEVEVNTGFYQVPKERATGSFTFIDNQLLNRAVGGNVLQRLEGVASGVQFTNANGTTANDIRVRGLATIQSDETPLIVVDNFPYEGAISNINPNDVSSVTVLKDAAAASIWGARAGNGVIVITTKSGHYNQKGQISFNSNVTVGRKPDLFYNQNRLPSETVMQIEKEKYEQGGYYLPDANQTPFPEYVELLIKRDDGDISEADFLTQESLMKNTEVRDQALRYLYQPSVYQSYALNARGGGQVYNYYFSAGYDKSKSNVVGNSGDRLNLNLQNTFMPFKGLELSAGVWYTDNGSQSNGLSLDDLGPLNTSSIGVSPYMRLKDNAGNALPIVKDYRLAYVDKAESLGLLDWQYRPLDELKLADNQGKSTELRLNGGLKYDFLKYFNVNATYQFTRANGQNTNFYDKDSYYARNMVNRFSQPNGSKIIPYAGIFNAGSENESISHSGRAQFNYSQNFGLKHQVSALGGTEIRQLIQNSSPGYVLYNYDPDLLLGTNVYNYNEVYPIQPTGSAFLPSPPNSRTRFTDRYLSYFGNASYTYQERYILSGSARWDGSNLFGVKTNQKGTPLWSVGGSWETSKESFYHSEALPYLRWRLTYGSSGNVNKDVSVYPTIGYATATYSQLYAARVLSAGNPSLRWEQVNTLNMAMDFSLKKHTLSGSIDYYIKNAHNLIGADYFAPSTGIIKGGTASATSLVNYADLRTHGLDIQLSSQNIRGVFNWQSTLLLSYVKNKVTNYKSNENTPFYSWFDLTPPPTIGQSRDVVYALPWYGLDHETGYPIVYLDGQASDDYAAYYNSRTKDDLIIAGVHIPPVYGSLRNSFNYKGISLDFMITWKSGYVFRRGSMNSGNEYNGIYHMDYFKRWQKPGDENFTSVTVAREIGVSVPSSGPVYNDSEALITKGDNIRLQDINLSYNFSKIQFQHMPFQNLRLYAYARNLGILWKSNKDNIDPDYTDTEYPDPKMFALGLQIDF